MRRISRIARNLSLTTVLTASLYFGPWFPTTPAEAQGWFRYRSPVTASVDSLPGRASSQALKSQTVEFGRDTTLLVVIPARFSERVEILQKTIDRIKTAAAAPHLTKVVVVHDDPDVVSGKLNFSELHPNSRVIKGNGQGRGPTQNIGARNDQSPFILFCHADTLLPTNFDDAVRFVLRNDPTVLMTAFTFGLDASSSKILDFIVQSANLRSRFWWMPYGDQALAFPRKVFEDFGGFRDDYKMMEDFELVRRVRSEALVSQDLKIFLLPDAVQSSARRWEERGMLKTTALNWLFCALYVYLGVSPTRIFDWYYR